MLLAINHTAQRTYGSDDQSVYRALKRDISSNLMNLSQKNGHLIQSSYIYCHSHCLLSALELRFSFLTLIYCVL